MYRYREHRILNLVTVVFLEDALDLEEVVEWGLAFRVVFLIRAAVISKWMYASMRLLVGIGQSIRVVRGLKRRGD